MVQTICLFVYPLTHIDMKFNVFNQDEVVFTGSKKACEGFTKLYKGAKFSVEPINWQFYSPANNRFAARDVSHLDTRVITQHRSYAQHRGFISIERKGTRYCFATTPDAKITQRGGTLRIDSSTLCVDINYKSLDVKTTSKQNTTRYSLTLSQL